MEVIHQFLLRVKRRTEQDNEIITSKICSAKEISDFIEFLDLQDDVVDYDIKYINYKTFRLHKVSFKVVSISYETGSHVRYICKGPKVIETEWDYTNKIAEVYYSSDH